MKENVVFAKMFEKEKKREMIMNLKALKFWSIKTMNKVLIIALKPHVEKSMLKWQRALQAFMF